MNGVQFSGCSSNILINKIKAQRSGFDFERRSKAANAVFGRGRSLEPETKMSGLCDDDAPLAQLVEQLTLNQWVPGSSP